MGRIRARVTAIGSTADPPACPFLKPISINSVRAICQRCPLAMTESLLGDLIQYRKHKNKRCDRRHASLLNRVDAASLNLSLLS